MGIPLAEYWQLLRRYLMPQRGAAALMAVLFAIHTGFAVAVPQVVRAFIDAATSGAAQVVLVRAALFFLGVSLARRLLGLLANYCGMRVGWAAINALRIDLIAHIVQLDLSFHKSHPPGTMIERIDGDVDALADFFSSFAVDLVGNTLLIVGILVVVTLESVGLGVMLLVYCVVALAVLVRVQRLAPPHQHASRQREAEFYGYVGEMLTATEDIRSCGAARYAVRRFLRHLRMWWPVQLCGNLWGSIWLATAVVSVIGGAVAHALAGPMAARGAMTLGTLYMIARYMQEVTWGPIQGIQWRLERLQHAQVSIVRVRELLDTRPEVAEGSLVLPPGPLSIAFRDVRFAYPDALVPTANTDGTPAQTPDEGNPREGTREAALQGLSFALDSGQVLGLLGRTGSGKTTVARLLYRFYDPQQGRVEVSGVDLRQAEIASLRTRIGMVTQDVQLFQASLRDNLTFFDPDVPDDVLSDTLEALGLTPWLGKLPQGLDSPISSASLSAGEAQLVALARVFLQNPDLVILDEAASRLDPATEVLLDRVLDRLLAGRSAVVIAHRLRTVRRADRILILDEGRAVEAGPRAGLEADPQSRFAALLRSGLEEAPG